MCFDVEKQKYKQGQAHIYYIVYSTSNNPTHTTESGRQMQYYLLW